MINVATTIIVCPSDRSRLLKKKKPFEEQTIIANLSKDYIHYYNYLFSKQYGILLEPSAFGSHVTINNGKHEIKNWNEDYIVSYLTNINNTNCFVETDPVNIYVLNRYIIIPVYCKTFDNIRQMLSLPKLPFFHCTVGRIKNKHLFSSTIKRKQISGIDENSSFSLIRHIYLPPPFIYTLTA